MELGGSPEFVAERCVTRARLLAELAQVLFDETSDLAERLCARPRVRAREAMPGAAAIFREILCSDPAIRRDVARRVFEGDPGHWQRAALVFGGVSELLEQELRRYLADPRVRREVGLRAAPLNAASLVGLLRWAYRFEPELGESIERAIVGDARRRIVAELLAQPHNHRACENSGQTAPLLSDLARAARKRGADIKPLCEPARAPRGFRFEVADILEREPNRAPEIGLREVVRFIGFPHQSSRRSIAAEVALRHLRAAENLNEVVRQAFEMGPSELTYILAWSKRSAPEISAALNARLEDARILEERLDLCLDRGGLDDLAGFVGLLGQRPRTRAMAEEMLAGRARHRRMAETGFRTGPARWIKLLRQSKIARPFLDELDRSRWHEFWCSYPSELPDWARALQDALRRNGSSDLEWAPAEYVLLGTGREEWCGPNVTLRNLANALFCRGDNGDDLVLGFLDRIGYRSFLNERYATESVWALAHFIDSLQAEQSADILRAVVTESLLHRFWIECEAGWGSRTSIEVAGFLAFLGVLSRPGVPVAVYAPPPPPAQVADLHAFLESPELPIPGGLGLVSAGLQNLSAARPWVGS